MIVGGLDLLGLLGLFVGPVVLALAGALLRDWTTNRSRSRVPRVSPVVTASA